MEKVIRLADFWRFLPVFRIVAETGRIRRAAELFHISPSSISRTIALLEENVGVSLFKREGKRLSLTKAGLEFTNTVRDAMRLMDDGLQSITTEQFTGVVRVYAPQELEETFLKVSKSIRGEHPELCLVMVIHPVESYIDALLTGNIDVAVVPGPPTHDDRVQHKKLTELSYSLYCGSAHPSWPISSVRAAEIKDASFAAVVEPNRYTPLDPWPRERARRLSFASTSLSAVVTSCIHENVIALLPDTCVRKQLRDGMLRRLPYSAFPKIPFYSARRIQLTQGDLASLWIDALESAVRLP